MKNVKKPLRLFILSLLCIIIAAGGAFSTIAANSGEATGIAGYITSASSKSLWADGFGGRESDLDAIRWYYHSDGKYYLLLPSTADLTALTIWHNFTGDVMVASTKLISGQSYSIFSNNTEYTLTAEGKSYKLVIMKSSIVGAMFLTTATGSMDYVHAVKGNADSGSVLIAGSDATVYYDGALESIKGRGNTTWAYLPKKPYNIKLSKKTSLFGMSESKKWTLLANAQDHSSLRNRIMYDMADEIGLKYSCESKFADIYANGEYLGTYQVTEKVEAGKNYLVKIYDLEDETEKANGGASLDSFTQFNANKKRGYNIPVDPADITGGYLLEYGGSSDDPSGFITTRGQGVSVKDPEAASKAQVDYISAYVQEMEDAIYSTTGSNSLGKHYTDYLDITDAAKMYLLQEFSLNTDGGQGSCYFYKNTNASGDSKIHASPAWDFDVALGNLTNKKDGIALNNPNAWLAKIATRYNTSTPTIFAQLCKHDDFWKEVIKVWNADVLPAIQVIQGKKSSTECDRLRNFTEYTDEIASAMKINYIRWKNTLTQNLLVPAAGSTHESQLAYLIKFINDRTAFMTEGLADLDSAKKSAKEELDAIVKAAVQSDYTEEKWAQILAAAEKGKGDIDKCTDSAQVQSVKLSSAESIKKLIGIIIYFDNTETKWQKVYAYTWGGTVITPIWPGTEIFEVEPGIFRYELEDITSPNIIFNNASSTTMQGKQQTATLSVPESGSIFKPLMSSKTFNSSKGADIFTGTFSKYVKTVVKYYYGDANLDGVISLKDATLIQKYLASLATLNNLAAALSDVTADSNVSLKDATTIQKYIAALSNTGRTGQEYIPAA